MRYEAYQNRISKIATILRTVLARWPFYLLQCILVIAAVVVFLITKGTVLSVSCAQNVTYGDELECKSLALFSKTHLEYRINSGEWTTDVPVMPGEYELRVVGKGFFGSKISNPVSFTISKRMLSLHSANGTVNYGEKPVFSANLAYGDTLHCNDFEIGSIFAKSQETNLYVSVKPLQNAISILNAEGLDVTWAYDIKTEREELRVIPREITVTVQNASKIYDGVAFSFDGYELTNGSLADGDSLFAYFTKSIVDVGSIENTPQLALINENGTNVTPCYNITVVEGLLTVEKRPLIIKTESGEFEYNATPHSLTGYEINTDTPLVDGQSLSILWGSKTDAGEYENIPAEVIITATESDTTDNYSIFFDAGTLKIIPIEITVTTPSTKILYQGVEQRFSFFGILSPTGTGQITGMLSNHQFEIAESSTAIDVGTYENDTCITIFDRKTGEDVTHNYAITYNRGTITIIPHQITITTASRAWTYDGRSHYHESVSSDYLASNDKILVTENTSVKDVGVYPNILSVKIVREIAQKDTPDGNIDDERNGENGEESYIDVTHNYSISYFYGSLAISQRNITLKPSDESKIYDETPLTSTILQVTSTSENTLPTGHLIFDAQTNGSLTDVGTITNYIVPGSVIIHDENGKNVTSNYNIRLSVGLLTVKSREILIQTGGAVKKYDGIALKNPNFTLVTEALDSLVEGHTITVETIGSLTRIGKTENICHLDKTKIYNADGEDVTKNYSISYSYGILQVYGDSNQLSGAFNESGSIGSFKNELESYNKNPTVILPSLLKVMDERNGYIYLRLKSFGGYTGNAWNEATEYSQLLSGQYSANYLATLALSSSTKELSIIAKNPYYFMPYYSSTDVATGQPLQLSDVIYTGTANGDLETLYTVSYKDYDYSTRIAIPNEYAEFEEAYRAFVYSQYLILDDETRAYMEEIIQKEGFEGKDIETVLKAAMYIQNSAIYQLDYDETLDREENIAIAFLEIYRTGISQHFASALTLLYRAMGIPARYTVGFATPTVKDQWVEVDRSRVHAWVEVYIDSVGWIEIEATGGNSFGLNGSGGAPKKQEIVVKPIYCCKSYDGRPLAASSIIDYDPTLAALAAQGYFWSVHFSGSITDVGSTESIATEFILYDPYGNDVTGQYNIVYEKGILEVFEADATVIKVNLGRLQKYYDGSPLSFKSSDYTIQGIAGIDVDIHISMTDAGYITLSDLNENRKDYVSIDCDSNLYPKVVVVFSEYPSATLSIRMTEPILKISPKTITVIASSASKYDDGTPLTSNEAFLARGSLANGHSLSVTVKGTITRPGTTSNEIVHVLITDENGEDVTNNYAIIPINGTLTIYSSDDIGAKG